MAAAGRPSVASVPVAEEGDGPAWEVLHDEKENMDVTAAGAALLNFDTCTRLGPKIGLTRRDRLARADFMQVPVDRRVRAWIANDDAIGDYKYTGRLPRNSYGLTAAARIRLRAILTEE